MNDSFCYAQYIKRGRGSEEVEVVSFLNALIDHSMGHSGMCGDDFLMGKRSDLEWLSGLASGHDNKVLSLLRYHAFTSVLEMSGGG